MEKPFLLFSGSNYYPSGGWIDFVGAFASTEEAKTFLLNNSETYCHDWWHIVDIRTEETVEKGPPK